jgi:hypothetical protein
VGFLIILFYPSCRALVLFFSHLFVLCLRPVGSLVRPCLQSFRLFALGYKKKPASGSGVDACGASEQSSYSVVKWGDRF